MDDVGAELPHPTDRRYGPKEVWHANERLLDLGVLCEHLEYDSYWLTEHHFQHEGYEVVPNALIFGVALAERTDRIRIGSMFNVVPQWHPLKLAEDFAFLHNLSGGRAILGVGRGTVPREAETLGTAIGSTDNPDAKEADRRNRLMFSEGMEVILAALEQDEFSYHGEVYEYPPPGIPDRGGTVETLSLLPRPLYPYEVWQPIGSPATLEYVPRMGFGGVFWNWHHDLVAQRWNVFAEHFEGAHGRALAPGEKRMLVATIRIGDTHDEALESARAGHDEFWKFLGPYGWGRGYLDEDGNPYTAGARIELEDSMRNRTWLVGTADEVAEQIDELRTRLGLADLTIFPSLPGDTYTEIEEQVTRFAEEVRPQLV